MLDTYGVSPLHLAAENGRISCLRVLLDAGAACNVGTAEKRPQWVTTTGNVCLIAIVVVVVVLLLLATMTVEFHSKN